MNAGEFASREPANRTHYRGRFAPSPTGPLHFGSLVAALASYCDARAAGGEWLLRIEDVDAPRARDGAEAQILAALERYGFAWDGSVVRQSDRTPLYEEALAQLRAAGHAYACACTRRELEVAPFGISGERVYPGTCRDGIPGSRGGRRQRAWRVRVADAIVDCNDRLQGAQRQALARDVGDFVVRRADGLFAYQLAVVVDDARARNHRRRARRGPACRRRRARSCCRSCSACPRPPTCTFRSRSTPRAKSCRSRRAPQPLPDSPLPTLLAAWRFLGQEIPAETPADVARILALGARIVEASRLPPVPMLPAPAAAGDAGGTCAGL